MRITVTYRQTLFLLTVAGPPVNKDYRVGKCSISLEQRTDQVNQAFVRVVMQITRDRERRGNTAGVILGIDESKPVLSIVNAL